MNMREAIRRIRLSRPIRDVLAFNEGKLDVAVTSSSLFSDVNSNLPSSDIIEYLYDISSSSNEELRIILPKECTLESVKKIYLNYLSLSIKKDLKEYRTIMIKIVSFLIFGCAVLTLSYFLEGSSDRIFYDAVNIIGGFAVWEAAEVFFFQRSEKRKEIVMKIRLLEAEWSQC